MPRYFFHVRDGDETRLDNEGSELPDLDAVRSEAVATAGEMLRHTNHHFRTGQLWNMDVADGTGALVCRLTFTATMTDAFTAARTWAISSCPKQ